jgi:3-oxoacyl-[acyl-carrier-protein] synthase I
MSVGSHAAAIAVPRDAAAVVVAGVGAQTAVGRNVWSTAAAVRAGVSGFLSHPLARDRIGEPYKVAMCPWLDDRLRGVDRLEALLLPALNEARAGWESDDGETLLLCVSQQRAGVPVGMADELVRRLRQRHSTWLRRVEVLAHGHAAGLLAVSVAANDLRAGASSRCLVAAVDSHLGPATLNDLESHAQVHGAGALNNAWGFVPGEASSALMLARADHAASRQVPTFGVVVGAGRAVERNCLKTDTVCIGEGLTAAVSAALKALPDGAQVSDVYCDLNGEPYRSDEYAFTAMRLGARLRAAGEFTAPADCWGDVGAAGGALNVVYACTRFAKGIAAGQHALVWASAENGQRAAVLLAEEQ